MRNKCILWATAALLVQSAFSFTKMDITRVLLMNDDTNETWSVSGQGYINTNAWESAYWTHEGDEAPYIPKDPAQIADLGLLDGTYHQFYAKLPTEDGLDTVLTPLWRLENCRAGNAATTNYLDRHFVPWSSTAVPRDGDGVEYESVDIQITVTSNWVTRPKPAHWVITETTNIVSFYDFTQVATVNMQNTTNSFVISPYYKDGIGAIYFDFVNGWYVDNNSEIQLQISTGTNGLGTLSFAEETNHSNLLWRTQAFDVLRVQNKTALSVQSTGVSAFTPAAPANSFYGNFFYRARSFVNLHQPARFRIWRSKRYMNSDSHDTTAYIILDNIVASFPPVELEIKQYGKYDKTRRGSAVIGQEGVFNVPFPREGQKVRPWAYYVGKQCPYAETSINDFEMTNPRFYYRWRYLNQMVESWSSNPLDKSSVSNLTTKARYAIGFQGPGDLEFYYTFNMTKAPHYEPFDFSVGLAAPYGAGWAEDGTAWTVTQRRDPAEGVIAATQGTDWFTRIREYESACKEVILSTSTGDPDLEESREQRNIQMELAGDHTWRAYLAARKDDVGKSVRFRFTQTLFTAAEGGGYDSNITYWAPAITTNSVVPCSAISEESISNYGETIFDGLSGHLMIEYNDNTHSVTITRSEYQNFNLWTDANRENDGYVGYSVLTNDSAMSGVSPNKREYLETFDKWQAKDARSVYWVEDFSGGVNDTGYPFNIFYSKHKTPNGWAAENLMFVGELYSAAYVTNGMALQLEGRGKGFVQLADKESMPDGLDTVSFNARAAQFLEFDDFAYYLDGNTFEDYAVGAKITFTNKGSRDRDVSPGAPSLSLVGYYRATKGCYELRFTRVSSTQIEMALYRWNKSGRSVSSTLLKKQMISADASGAKSLWPTSTTADDAKWTGAYMAFYNGESGTYITVALANQANADSMAVNNSSGRFADKFTYVDTDTESRHVKGSFGVGSCDCPGRFGRIAQYNVTLSGSGDSASVAPSFATEVSTAALLGDEDNWALPPGRMELISDPTQLYTWNYGIKACNPDQWVDLYLAKTGSGNDWFHSGYSVAVTSFVAQAYEMSPRFVDKYNVRLAAGGVDNDARIDVVVDDLELTQWHSGSWGDWSQWTYPIAYTNWVYEQCWVESIAEISDPGAYELKTLSDTGEYVYIFTNSCKFTPKVDLEVSRALIVGGGGGGGAAMGGGGGGGGVTNLDWTADTVILPAGREVIVTVGAGGAVPTTSGTGTTATSQPAGKKGGDSKLEFHTGMVDVNVTAYGGAGGNGWGTVYSGTPYASGGGGAANTTSSRNVGLNANQTAQGNKGGNGGYSNNNYGLGGGGGGAGTAGEDLDVSAKVAGKGGDGRLSDITGTVLYYGAGGGGGGGYHTSSKGGEGGKSGDGTGYWGKGADHKQESDTAAGAQPGQDGFGGGGGGGTYFDPNTNLSNNQKSCGARGGSGAVILRLSSGGKLATMHPRRSKPNQAVMIRSPYLNGISLFSFSYVDADPNANLRLQMATNSFGTGDFRQLSQSLTDDRWIDLTNFTFKTQSSGTYTYFVGLREPIYGFVRLLCEPSIVYDTATNDLYAADSNYKHGAVTLTSVVAYDEPILDDRSWFGWNMRTTDDSHLAYLPDPSSSPAGLAGALNFSGDKDDKDANYADEIAATNGLYSTHDPFFQSPAIYNEKGVGQVQFRARVMDTNATVSSWVSLYGSADSQADDEDWSLITTIEVTNRTFRSFTWKTTDDVSPYKTIRLAVHAAKYGRYGDTSQDDGKPIATPIQRVLVDELAVTEPVAPGLSFAAISPFRTKLSQHPVKFVTNARSMDQQPLLGESFGVQVEVALAQLADELDLDSIRVFMAYYPKSDLWGYAAWSNAEEAVSCELVRCSDSNLVWRSAYEPGYEDSVIPPQQDPGDGNGVVVQYHIWAEYLDTSGTNHSHRVLSTEWHNPTWYHPLDFNRDNGGYSDESKFCPYTILQTISPKRAWINCMNLFDGDQDTAGNNQFLELAVPAGIDMEGWYLRFTEKSLGNTTVFARLGEGGIKSEKLSANVYNSYDFLTMQAPATTSAKGNAADGSWYGFGLEEDSSANGTFRATDCYAVELFRPNGIIEHQIVIGGTNQWQEYIFSKEFDPAVLRDKLVEKARVAGTDDAWVLAGADENSGAVGVMANHGASTNDWEVNLAQTPEARNRRRNGTYQTIPADWYIQPSGTNYWIYSYLFGGYISQQSGKETGDAIRLIVPKGSTTNITYTVEPWHRIGTILSNEVSIAAPPFNPATLTYTYVLKDVSENINLKVRSGVSPEIDSLIPATDSYHDAVVRWLEGYNCESNIVMTEFQLRNQAYNDKYLSLKEMYWLDIYPFQTNRLVVGIDPLGPVPVPEAQIDTTTSLPALTNMRVRVYMMITNRETGVAYAPNTIQGLSNESSGTDYSESSSNWTSATYKVVGNLLTIEGKWRPLRYFVFDSNSFLPKGHPKEFTAEIDVWDPFSSKTPIYTDPDVRWWPYRGNDPVLKATLNEGLKPVRVDILKPQSYLTE